ncbi:MULTISPECIES: tetratricopeptide repeat protein [unclassified Variovorax]|uniref:tetratricopeptide repeat protein n=1 Tax=unclassified Variovorax TaxID=663243 RepID=UPI00076D655B|nr:MULTISPECIES: tetratricopeptide repeat protein [unclassified Variovorax]KWT69015.1 TPR repeat [Variovorax sp. WDL1]PNG56846.1 Beta-barrel assembly-enhancing protease [Variovorax sp. B4]PNG58270.1 Beta-barrel assembly-enhancing protease [Variovorax sp. B2]VTV09205.1 type IV pilus biogenesis/stability protein PilW [Variovorax sp. WDL1]
MSAAGTASPYTMRRVQQMLGISRVAIQRLVSAGFVTPTRGTRNEFRFSFQDLMLLRTAQGLQEAQIPPRKILRSLRRLRATLPEELPLTGMRITAVGADVAVRDRRGTWEAGSGQLLLDFEVAPVDGRVAFLDPNAARSTSAVDAQQLFAHAEALEDTDPAQAEAAYRAVIAAAPDHIDAYVNLGALLCDQQRYEDAAQLHESALPRCPASALLFFNYAIALEELGRLRAAALNYERSLQLDPDFADAHYNLGRLQELFGDARGALRHLNAYRRLTR